MILNRHFREFIELLEKHHVEYLVVGGYGVGFDVCYQHRVLYREGTLAIPFIAVDDLIANKEATPRAKGKIDLEELRKIRNEKSPYH